jgi:transposase-like protein
MAKRKYRRYADEFRASAVLMAEAAGWPGTDGAVPRVSDSVGVPQSTLRGWLTKKHNPPPAEVRVRKKVDFEAAIELELEAILSEMGHTRQDAPYNQLATAFGIMFDKLQLLRGGATANINQRVAVLQWGDANPSA